MDKPDSWATWLTSVAAIFNAIAWPAVVGWLLLSHRVAIANLLEAFGHKLSTSGEVEVKAGPFALKAGEDVLKKAVDEARSQASAAPPSKDDPAQELKNFIKQLEGARNDAAKVEERLEATQLSESGAKHAVRTVIFGLAEEYDHLRSKMPSSPERTRKMNEIAAGMRTMAFEGLALRTELTRSDSVGKRLAAICMLQVEPRPRYFRWLIERLRAETQAFVLYQTSIAILEHVKRGLYTNPDEARAAIGGAIQIIASFPGGQPDQNTLEVLNEALSLVR
ncbi:MAG: hypothetical protein ABSB60_14275 [Terracidiphilus sp.]|jgi:hypothetical protein